MLFLNQGTPTESCKLPLYTAARNAKFASRNYRYLRGLETLLHVYYTRAQFSLHVSLKTKNKRWCRGGELNSLRRPFQGRALPVSYPGTGAVKDSTVATQGCQCSGDWSSGG